MAEDWLVDVRKWAPNADEGVVGAIIKYCGIALQSRDGSLVAMSDKKERELVRENYLKKKLGLTLSDETLDEAVIGIGQHMKSDRTKNRVTVYYLLAEHFGALNIFGGAAGAVGAAGALAGGAAALMGGGAAAAATPPEAAAPVEADTAPLAMAGLAGAGLAGTGAAVAAADTDPEPAPAYATSNYDDGAAAAGGGMGWLKWLIGALLLGAILFFVLRSCSPSGDAPAAGPVEEPTAGAEATTPDIDPTADEPKAEATADIAPAEAAAVPTGSGVVAGERNGKPMLTVYFDQAKTNLPADFDKVAAVIKDYAAKNPGAKFAVSGFNSPTGSAAGNARLSKGRAENVGAALQKLGVSASAVELVKPAAATQGVGEDAKARRVEVTVQ
jgi:outer membrane protein OmpA-like peptidoglycan-associated protein